MSAPVCLVWFRRDLRLADQPALNAAARLGGVVIPVYVFAPEEESTWAPGGASRYWLHQSLTRLKASLEKAGSRLILRTGPTMDTLASLIEESAATHVFWNRLYDPVIVKRDKSIQSGLEDSGVEARGFKGTVLFEPWEIENKSGDPYRVFTPYYNACLRQDAPGTPLEVPDALPAPDTWPVSLALEELALEPKFDWAADIRDAWSFGETAAHTRLGKFLDEAVDEYPKARDIPGTDGVSRMSPHLHFGEISPRQIWRTTQEFGAAHESARPGAESFLRQLCWREFSHHLLYYEPHTTDEPLRPEFAEFPWRDDAGSLRRWQKGATGYPIVDAGMRELWATGWMHNRVRMIVASFLIKDLMIPWQEGAAWFWDTLVDADLANNTMGWQWTAGSGADAAPYFRVFNPVTQAEKFDRNAMYVRRWCPELADVPDKWIQKPWEAPADVLKSAGVSLGKDYPKPIVDHAEARKRALEAYDAIKGR